MTLSNQQIKKIVLAIEDCPRWLVYLEIAFGQEVADYAAEYHPELLEARSKAEKFWLNVERKKVFADLKQFKLDNHEFKMECEKRRRDELIAQSEALEAKIEEEVKKAKDKAEIAKIMESNNYKQLEALEKQLSGKITEEMIMQAKEFPLENLIEFNSAGFALCLEHKDSQPSMFCKKNFVHCFSCGFSGDTIAVLMKRDGISFPEAVRLLQQ